MSVLKHQVGETQFSPTVKVEQSQVLILQSEGSRVVMSDQGIMLLDLHFKTSSGKNVIYNHELFDQTEGSLWQEFKKLFAKYTEGSFKKNFKQCAEEFIKTNAGRRVEVTYKFVTYDHVRLFPTKPKFKFI